MEDNTKDPYESWHAATRKKAAERSAAIQIQPISGKAPDRRVNHKVASDGETLHLFGGVVIEGRTPYYKNDLWKYERKTGWERLNDANPPVPRAGHALVKRSDEVLVLFGGMGENGELNDMHQLDLMRRPLTWSKMHPGHLPPRRLGHTLDIYEETYLILHGGKGPQGQLNDTWVYHIGTGSWREVHPNNAPDPRWYHTSCIIDGFLYIMGGGVARGDTVIDTNKIFTIDVASLVEDNGFWRKSDLMTDERPRPRRGHSLTVFGAGFIIFGGTSTYKSRFLDTELGDVYYFDIEKQSWRLIPSPRGYRITGHSSSCLHTSSLFIFGGSSDSCSETIKKNHFFRFQIPSIIASLSERTVQPKEKAYTGNYFGISVGRHFMQGDYDPSQFADVMLDQKWQHEQEVTNRLYDPTASGCIMWKEPEKSIGFNLVGNLKRIRNVVKKTRANVSRVSEPCGVCGNEVDAIFLPCGHVSVCLFCAVQDNKFSHCPNCFEPVTSLERLFALKYAGLRRKLVVSTPLPSSNQVPENKKEFSADKEMEDQATFAIPSQDFSSFLNTTEEEPPGECGAVERSVKKQPKPLRTSIWCRKKGML